MNLAKTLSWSFEGTCEERLVARAGERLRFGKIADLK